MNKKLLLIFCMLCVAVFCFSAFAVSASATETTAIETERTVTASGTCGAEDDNLTWALYNDGELVISGTGNMEDYAIQRQVELLGMNTELKYPRLL